VQALKQEQQQRSSTSPTAAQAKLGFGGLGAHPLLAARTFAKPGFKKNAPGNSHKSESPSKGRQPAAAAGASPFEQQQQQLPQQAGPEQQQQQQEQSAYAEVAPSFLPGLSAKLLAGFAAPQPAHMAEDDYDDDYDS
jgi:hypothetical protein